MLADNDLSHAISCGDFQDPLDSNIVPVAPIAGDDKLLLCVGEDGKDRRNEVFEIVLLVREDARLLAQATSARLLVLEGGRGLGDDLMYLINHILQ